MKAVLCTALLASVLVSTTTLAQGPSGNAKYIGVSKCAMCHSDVHKSWKGGAHSRAFDLLVNVGEEKNEKCLPCHSTGFNKGGFKDVSATPELQNVTCEACHGPGSEHNGDKEKIVRTPSAAACASCHQEMNIHSL